MSELLSARELKARIKENDTRSTSLPYLLLLQEKEKYVAKEDYAFNTETVFVERNYDDTPLSAPSLEQLVEKYNENVEEEDALPLEKWVKGKHYDILEMGHSWSTCNVFLTDKGYEDHLRANKHNLKQNHRTFGVHAFRNLEMRSLYALIDSHIALEDEFHKFKLICDAESDRDSTRIKELEAEVEKYVQYIKGDLVNLAEKNIKETEGGV